MKKMILAITVLLSVAFNAQARSKPMAETVIGEGLDDQQAIVELFNKEALIKNSPINKYMEALRADPDNKDFYIYDEIDTGDIVRLDSGAGGGTFEINYLIIIRAGFKSNTFAVGYLKAQTHGPIDQDAPTYVKITEPAKVSIE
jgi:hypothetical protein